MSDLAIRVEGLGKLYHIGAAQERYPTIRESIVNAVKAPLQRLLNPKSSLIGSDTIWALKDVSFEIKKGEAVGIIGRNGAGKSTLLKVLSHITEPTRGRVRLHGRVGPLLEVGTGFHPELTGRENIYMNAAILGMKRAEIVRKFDEIVDFAEIEKFLDTPVKRYSSGMYVRLAFSVAAHLNTEILLIDEVLAVGDASFQKKCLGKMEDVAGNGRTVLFVSHNLVAVKYLCQEGIILDKGKIVFYGKIEQAIACYENQLLDSISSNMNMSAHVLYQKPPDQISEKFSITRIEFLNEDGTPVLQVHTWSKFTIRVHYYASQRVNAGSIVLRIGALSGEPLLLFSTQPGLNISMCIQEGHHFADCVLLGQLPLSAGDYVIGCGLAIPNKEWLCLNEALAKLSVKEKDVFDSGLAPVAKTCLIAIPYTWKV